MGSKAVLMVAVALLLMAAGQAGASEGLTTLVEWMTGSFSSEEQSLADTTYYDIRLEMVAVWPERQDGAWLYIEQAVAGAERWPYRQRVYHLVEIEADLFKSEVYELPGQSRFAGAWRYADPLAALSPDSLAVRDGCAVFLRRDPSGEFAGNTVGHSCASSMNGARYAASEVVVGPWGMKSWDRGFNADGVQVWGAEGGPYVFLRRQ